MSKNYWNVAGLEPVPVLFSSVYKELRVVDEEHLGCNPPLAHRGQGGDAHQGKS